MNNNNTPEEILQDIKNGKAQPWQSKKSGSNRIAYNLGQIDYKQKASRLFMCGGVLIFETDPITGKKKLKSAQFCKDRLCLMCNWRKGLRVFQDVSKVMDVIENRHPNLQPIFLTLTQKNCEFSELLNEMQNILDGFYRLSKHRQIRTQVEGWFRAVEVTYNADTHTWHPHIHAIFLVDKSYFKKDNKKYITTSDFSKLWRTSMRLDYNPIVHVQRLKAKKNKKHSGVAEAAKYTLKDDEILKNNDDMIQEMLTILVPALRRKRLFAFGGIMKKIAIEIKADKLDEGNLMVDETEIIREDVGTILERYEWSYGINNYIKAHTEEKKQ